MTTEWRFLKFAVLCSIFQQADAYRVIKRNGCFEKSGGGL